jgi:glycosyltransferase involved in cell wall biosynthesis
MSPPRARILMVGPVPPPYGGIATLMDEILRSDLADEFHFDVFDRPPDLPADARGFWKRNTFRLKRFLSFFKLVKKEHYDLVHIHSADPAFLGTTIFMGLSRLARARVLLHTQGTDWSWFYPEAPLIRRIYTRLGLALPDAIVVLYAEWLDEIRRLRVPGRTLVLRNLVRDAPRPPEGECRALREMLGLGAEHFVVVSVGTIGQRKGSFDIVNAAEIALRQDESLRFVLVGGEEKPGEMVELTALISAKGLSEGVMPVGGVTRDTVPLYLGMADMFLLPSHSEGMPLAIIEAMRTRLPIVAAAVNAIPDMMVPEESGLLIEPRRPEEIAHAVLRLRRDPALRDRLGRGARREFEDRFEFDRGIEELRAIYLDILGR